MVTVAEWVIKDKLVLLHSPHQHDSLRVVDGPARIQCLIVFDRNPRGDPCATR
eukprot:m.449485 g.449485  ORF g.449485 m.449485 type:complete len:53 (-) comp163274_c0_seq1:20-178(-)